MTAEKLNFETKLIEKLCTEHNVRSLFLFGSYAKNSATDKSDIDFLVRFENVDISEYFDNFLNFKDKLEQIYGKKVDLVEEQTLKNPFLIRSINESKQLIWTQA